jgi:hypothetical protein
MKIDLDKIGWIALLISLCLLVLFSCKAKKEVTKTTNKSDTLIIRSFDYISKPIDTKYTIDLECDSLGNVRNVNQNQTSGDNSASLVIENNQLKARLQTAQSQITVDTIYKTKYKTKKIKDLEIRYRTPLWHWFAHALSLIIVFILIRFKFF